MGKSGTVKLWMFSIYYRPETFGIAPYATQIAEYMASFGSEVHTVTGMPHYPDWTLSREYKYRFRIHEKLRGVDVTRVRHAVPGRMTTLRRAMYELTYLLQALTALPKFRPQVVAAFVPNLSCGVAAVVHARRLGVPVVLFMQDLVAPSAGQSGIGGGKLAAWLLAPVEAWILRHATRVAILHEGFRDYVARAGVEESRIIVVPNWSHAERPLKTIDQTRKALNWPQGSVVVLHAGNMGLKQNLENVVDAAKRASEVRMDVLFVLMGGGSQREALVSKGEGVPTLRFADALSGAEFSEALAAADVLLVNERDSVRDMSLPSKLTAYFLSGRPVVAASSTGGTTQRELERSGGGLHITPSRPDELLDAVNSLASDERFARQLGQAGQAYAYEYLDRDKVLSRVGDLLLDACSK